MGDDWGEWANYVRLTLERIEKSQAQNVDDLYNKLNAIQIEIAVLKTKASQNGAIWGAIFGIISAVVAALIVRGFTHGG